MLQYAIVFTTPPYRDQTITQPVTVYIQLHRPTDEEKSEPVRFTYHPNLGQSLLQCPHLLIFKNSGQEIYTFYLNSVYRFSQKLCRILLTLSLKIRTKPKSMWKYCHAG